MLNLASRALLVTHAYRYNQPCLSRNRSDHVADAQICKAGVARMRKIWFSRHGESEYNMFAKIGGDSNISPQGQIYAKMLPDLLVDRVPLVLLGPFC